MADETEETTDGVTASEAQPEVVAEAPTTVQPADDATAGAPPVEAPAAPIVAATVAATPVEDGPRPNQRKVREGVVVSDAMQSTVVVAVVERVRHPRQRLSLDKGRVSCTRTRSPTLAVSSASCT